MITYKLHLIRHGMTAMNREGRYLGRMDEPLCPEGIAATRRKHETFTYPEAEAVYSCPLLRCRETADILFPDLPITAVEDLAEMAMGDFEGRSFAELQSDPAFEEWMNDSAGHSPPGGESATTFASRISDGLAAVFMDMQREQVRSAACIVSGGVIMSLLKQHTHSDQPLSAFGTEPLEGYTIALTTQLWASHRLIEIGARIPTIK